MPWLVRDRVLGVYMAEPIADVAAVTFTAILFAFRFRRALGDIEVGKADPDNSPV